MGIFSLMVFSHFTHKGQSERGTTHGPYIYRKNRDSVLSVSQMITNSVRLLCIRFACDFVLFAELIKQEQEQEE